MIPNEEKEDGYVLAVKEIIFIITQNNFKK